MSQGWARVRFDGRAVCLERHADTNATPPNDVAFLFDAAIVEFETVRHYQTVNIETGATGGIVDDPARQGRQFRTDNDLAGSGHQPRRRDSFVQSRLCHRLALARVDRYCPPKFDDRQAVREQTEESLREKQTIKDEHARRRLTAVMRPCI